MQGKESEWDVYVGWIQCTGYSWALPLQGAWKTENLNFSTFQPNNNSDEFVRIFHVQEAAQICLFDYSATVHAYTH